MQTEAHNINIFWKGSLKNVRPIQSLWQRNVLSIEIFYSWKINLSVLFDELYNGNPVSQITFIIY